MTAPTVAEQPTGTTTGPADTPVHITCCYDDIAMCGEQLKGEDTDDEIDCPLCVMAAGGPCTAPDCPFRHWWWRAYGRLRGWKP